MNKVILIGNLSKDFEIRYLNTGVAVGNTSLAVNRPYKTQDGKTENEVCFIDLSIFGRTAEVCNQYLKKGSKVCVEGRLVFQQWTDQHSNKKSKHIIAVEKVEFLNSKNEDDASNYTQQNASNNHTTQQANYTNNNNQVSNPQVETSIDLNEEIPF